MGRKVLTEEKKASLARASRGTDRIVRVLVLARNYRMYQLWRTVVSKTEGIRMRSVHGFIDVASNVYFDCVYIREEIDYADIWKYKGNDGNVVAVILDMEYSLHPRLRARLESRQIRQFEANLDNPVEWISHV